jgi:NAD(P)-dependent dehydrogenase (short-subunit alcohol dehydrogenase family)
MAEQWAGFPAHMGLNFTKKYHTHAEGPTDPTKQQLPSPFVVLITGAGKGLGYHISTAFAKAGASGIIIASRTASDLEKLSAEIKSINPNCDILSRVCDTTLDADLKTLAADVKAKYGRLDAAIANAGVISKYVPDGTGSHRLPIGILEDDDFERVVDINLGGSYRVAKHFCPLLFATKDGPQSYVVITSTASHFAESAYTSVAYNTTKIACNRLAEHMHNDHHVKDGLVAYAVHPGAVLTPQTVGHTGDIWGQSEFMLADYL